MGVAFAVLPSQRASRGTARLRSAGSRSADPGAQKALPALSCVLRLSRAIADFGAESCCFGERLLSEHRSLQSVIGGCHHCPQVWGPSDHVCPRSGCGGRLRPGEDAWIMSHWSREGAEGLGKAPKGFSCCSNPLPRAWPLHTLPGAPVSRLSPRCLGAARCGGRQGRRGSIDRSVEEANQGLVSRYHPGEPRPWPCSPCLGSSCTRCTALNRARSTPRLWEACGFPSALGPSHQALLWDLEHAWPWGKHSVTGNCSTRRNASPGSSHGGRQCFPGCREQRGVCGAGRVLSAALGAGWAPGVSPLPSAGVLGGRCPPVHRHTQTCRGTRVFLSALAALQEQSEI